MIREGSMRGEDRTSGALFSYVDIEGRIPARHPLRAMRRLTNAALADLDRTFSALYEAFGRPSIPPERRLAATLLQLLYSIRSERQLVERIEFDLLFRWFVGLSVDERVFDASTFSKNRDRLLTQEIAQGFLSSLLSLPEVKGLLSAEHFSGDGTLLKAWASMKSFRPKDGSGEPPSPGRNGEADFRKTKRPNGTGGTRGGGRVERAIARGRHPRRRQELRRRGIRRSPEGARDRAACGDQRDGQQERQSAQDRRPQRGRGEPRLCDQPAAAQTHRGMLRLGQNSGRARTAEGARPRHGPRRVRLRRCRLQSCSPAQAPGSDGRSVSNGVKRKRK